MFSFLAVAALVIVVAGQDTALTIRNTFGGGRPAGTATACGVACGLATWAVATAFGLAAILVASEPVYRALKAFGAAWLAAYATVVARAASVVDRPRARRAVDAVTGTVLVALGLKLLGDGSKT
jgi:threonine/homoserine/homoserine lactone efflux protein